MRVNGNLTLETLGLSEIQNAVIERVSSLPSISLSEKGRIVFNMTDSSYYYNDGTVWKVFSWGAGLQTAIAEIDSIESTLGTGVSSTGTFVGTAFSSTNYLQGATSFTNALTLLDASITGHNTLAELDDVTFTSLANGQFLTYNSTTSDWVNSSANLADLFDVTVTSVANKQVVYYNSASSQWVNQTLVLSDVSGVTTTAAELNQIATSGAVLADYVKLHAITASAAEINSLTGATFNAQDLVKLSQMTATAQELNYVDGVTSPIQTQLDNKQPLDADLTTIAAFAPTADSSETLTIGANNTSVVHAGQNDIMFGTGGAEGSRWTLKRGAAARTSLGLGNIAVMDEANFIRADAASSNIANDISFNGYKLTNLAPGVAATDAINLGQLQAMQGGLNWKQEADVATTANIALTGLQTIDGVAVTAGMIVLVKNQTTASQNGLYTVASGAWTRATDMDIATECNKATVFVKGGTAQPITQWTATSTITTLGTDPITFAQTNALNGVVAGIGLSKTGNQMDVNLGAGIVELPSDEIGIDLYDPTTSAIILTGTGTDRVTGTNAKLHLLLDLTANGQLVQSANGLKVTTNTITEAELTASVAGNGLVGGNGTALAVASAAGTASTGGDTPANWAGVGAVTVTANAVGVTLGSTSVTAAPGNHTHKAAVITFDNTTTSLAGTPGTVQAAIEAIDTALDDTFGDLTNVIAAAGLNSTTGAFVQHTTASIPAVNNATSMFAVDEALSTAVTDTNTRLTNTFFVYTSSAAGTSHTVTHNTGAKYCNVTVVDNTTGSATLDQVVIPNSITFNSTTALTVTFNTAIDCIVIVQGVA